MPHFVALVGDSLRMHYQAHVAAELAGVADVWGPDTNCESSRHLRSSLDRWVFDKIHRPTIVHVNAGAHDIRRTADTDWEVQVPIDEYRDNMAAIVDSLLAHRRVEQVIVATTTPVDEARHETARHSNRHNKDIDAYNRVLLELSSTRGLAVSDIWSAIRACPFDPMSEDGAHLTPSGNAYLGRYVAQQFSAILEKT